MADQMKTISTQSERTMRAVRFFIRYVSAFCVGMKSARSSLLAVEDRKCMDRFKAAALIQMKRVCVGGCDRQTELLETSLAKLLDCARDQAAANPSTLVSRMH